MEAAQLIIADLPPGPKQTEAAISVLHKWALQDVDGAAAWAEQFPAGPLRDRALNELSAIRKSRQTASLVR
jgi:hypothetical protein